MSTQLSQADVLRLLQEPSPMIRAEVAAKVAREIDSTALSEKEIRLAHDIVRVMARDVEAQVRQALSYSLRYATRLPHDVAVKLAQDVESVALPILEHSTVLTDQDLIEIVRQGSNEKQEVIATRKNVSEQLSDVLISQASEKAVENLMKNATAKIADASMDKAVERFEQSNSVKEAMVYRERLPATVAERLVNIVSEKLREHLVTNHELSPAMASDIVMKTCERALISMTSNSSTVEIERLVAQLYRQNHLSSSLVIRALCMGDVVFFKSAIAILANVPLLNARILLHDAGRLGLKTIYEKAGLPPTLFPAISMAMDVLHEMEVEDDPHALDRYRARVLERILTQFEDFHDMSEEDVDYLLEKLNVAASVATPHMSAAN